MPAWAGARDADFLAGALVAVFETAVFFVVAIVLLCHESAKLAVMLD